MAARASARILYTAAGRRRKPLFGRRHHGSVTGTVLRVSLAIHHRQWPDFTFSTTFAASAALALMFCAGMTAPARSKRAARPCVTRAAAVV